VTYLFVALLPLLLARWFRPASDDAFLEELGKGAALLGVSLLVLQFALSARISSIDRPFGLDAVMRFHKGMGVLAGALLLLHPVLLALSHGNWALLGLSTPWPINLGKAALLLLVLTVLLALFFQKLRLDYNVWRWLHKAAILVVALGFAHSLWVGADLQRLEMKAYWIALFAIATSFFLFRNVYVPLLGRKCYRVAAVNRESHDIWTLSFEPEAEASPIMHRPGQFWFIKLVRPGRSTEQHPFTISSAPGGEPPLTSTIKESGNFTRTIGQTRIGDRARVEGPFGRFSLVNYPAEAYLFVAGGVGITPIMSMLRYLRDTDDRRAAALIYGNKTESDILFRDELGEMSDHVKVTHVLSSPEAGWNGRKGLVTTDLLREEVGELVGSADVFLCGPPAMMDSVITSLGTLGVAGSRIHYERFTV
jgi:predicted ferric reductase